MTGKFKLLEGFSEEVMNNIRLIFVFGNQCRNSPHGRDKRNVFIVTNDDVVIALGENKNGELGLGHHEIVIEPQIVKELCGKQIINFTNGANHVIGLTKDGQVYCWGWNQCNQLGNATQDYDYGNGENIKHKPELNVHLKKEIIISIKCGADHSMALTATGTVYTWGLSSSGRLGIRDDIEIKKKIPHKLKISEEKNIVMISCGYAHSMVLTESGHAYSWGYNEFGQLGNGCYETECEPRRVLHIEYNSSNEQTIFSKISCGFHHSLLLSNIGIVYLFGSLDYLEQRNNRDFTKRVIPLKINFSDKIIDIASYFNLDFLAVVSENDNHYILGKCGEQKFRSPEKIELKTFHEIFKHYFEITYLSLNVSINLKTDKVQPYVPKDDKSISNSKSSFVVIAHSSSSQVKELEPQFPHYSRYMNEFKELQEIGHGKFGNVYKVKCELDQQHYAIKRIQFGDQKEIDKLSLKEIQVLARLRSDYFVQYNTSWVEDNKYLYIQMELCYQTLKNILEIMRNEFNRKQFHILSQTEYFICSEIYVEVLECVDFMHKLKPPIIHRDLKPSNILITKGYNKRFVKIGDFGLVTAHDFDDQTHTQGLGTVNYIAPEVLKGRSYDTKSDIYSLGVITQNLFDIDINTSTTLNIENESLMSKYSFIMKLIPKMMALMARKRPSCEKVLRNKKLWALSITELIESIDPTNLSNIKISKKSIEDCFHEFFIRKKIETLIDVKNMVN